MSEAYSADGRYWFIEQGDGNVVLYDRSSGEWRPAWDRWSFEAAQQQAGGPPQNPPNPPPADDIPAQDRPIDLAPITGDLRIIKVDDGPFAPRMMSDRANAWVISSQHAIVFAGSRATGGPEFFQVDLASGSVQSLGPMVPYMGETEGWFWLPDGRLVLFEGPRLHVINPFTGTDVVVIDISDLNAGYDLWQPHASDDGETFSATVRDTAHPLPGGKYPYVGTVTLHRGRQEFWRAIGELDESQVRRDGKGVLIKEDRGTGDDNRYIDLDTRDTYWRRDQERAIGHSDCGPNYVVGEADKPDPGACVLWYLDRPHESPRILFHTIGMGYVSVRGGRCLLSDATHLSLVSLEGAGLTPLIEHGAGGGYDDRVKANLSPCGRVACYMVHGAVYLLVIP